MSSGPEQLPDWLNQMMPGGPADYSKLGHGQWACPKWVVGHTCHCHLSELVCKLLHPYAGKLLGSFIPVYPNTVPPVPSLLIHQSCLLPLRPPVPRSHVQMPGALRYPATCAKGRER